MAKEKTTAKPRKKPTQAAKSVKKAKEPPKNRRELWGVLCVILALFGLLCYVNTDAFLIATCVKVVCGLIGQVGRYILPLFLIAVAIVLFRSKGRPVRLRIFCLLTLVLTISALTHVCYEAISGVDYKLGLKELWMNGREWGGGVISGLIAEGLEAAIMKAGAIIVLTLLLLLQCLTFLRITVDSLISAIKNRPKLSTDEKPEEPEVDPAERIVNHVANKYIEHRERRAAKAEIDVPVDEPSDDRKAAKPEEAAQAAEPKPEKKKQTPPRDPKLSEIDIPIDVAKNQVTIDEIELQDPEPTPVSAPTASEPAPMPAEDTKIDPISGMPVLDPKTEPKAEKLKRADVEESAAEVTREIEEKTEEKAEAAPEYVYPPVSLLHLRTQSAVDATGEMRENSKRLADALKSFGIEPHIVDVIRGPSVTRYELELDPGVKLSKITNLSDDIALSLGATGVRISAIPDKISVVGIEVPNKTVNTVYAREVIDSLAFRNSKSKISFAVGKDISGNCIVGDISKLPHMLIAGTTGSGKSVCMNTLIVSLLYKAKPDEVRLIMVDPKMVELGVYNGIPHLLIPVVTDPKKAAGALQWTVTEMMRRYRLMSDMGVRDLESYNKAVRGDPDQKQMEQIVVVIDELADLMLVAAKEVEESICRIAQMGRASGIHLVIATQRPSSDVITGLMKANIPSRIAFAVSSAMESRIILDTQGAEKLVGKGDMLFAPLGQGKPKRIQGCFITDEEVQSVVNAIKTRTESDYSEEIMEQIEKRAEQSGGKSSGGSDRGSAEAQEGDELLPAAVEVILETGQASVSMLQRRLKLGYARAARIVDEMEERGIVGPFEGAKPRQLLITKEQWEQMQNGTYNPPVEEEIP